MRPSSTTICQRSSEFRVYAAIPHDSPTRLRRSEMSRPGPPLERPEGGTLTAPRLWKEGQLLILAWRCKIVIAFPGTPGAISLRADILVTRGACRSRFNSFSGATPSQGNLRLDFGPQGHVPAGARSSRGTFQQGHVPAILIPGEQFRSVFQASYSAVSVARASCLRIPPASRFRGEKAEHGAGRPSNPQPGRLRYESRLTPQPSHGAVPRRPILTSSEQAQRPHQKIHRRQPQ
jgi:hypothetical protein